VDTLTNIDSLRGGDWDDILVGGSQSISIVGTRVESFIGGKGNDFIAGNGNAAEMGAVTNGDVDRVDYQFDPSSVLVTLGGGWARDGWGNTDTLRDINMVRGSNQSDSLFGGNPNNDYFEGFEGLRGDDIIDGLSGNDRVDYAASPDKVEVNLALGFAKDGWGSQDSLFNIEQARGSDFNDTLIGDANNNSFIGGAGNDTLDGAAGNDQANYRSIDYDADGDGLGVVVNLGASTLAGGTWESATFGSVLAGHATDSWGGDDTLISIEDVAGSVYNDVIVGSAVANVIDSGYGDDKLTGGGGADIFHFGQSLNWGGSPLPASNNVDTITDFTTGSDKLRLDDAVFTSLTGFTAANFKTGTGPIVLDGNDYLYFDTSSGSLYYDSDGSTGGEVLFAVLNGGTAASLAATDIMVV
jgi:Ca2+-binding RTX toxin-like protein